MHGSGAGRRHGAQLDIRRIRTGRFLILRRGRVVWRSANLYPRDGDGIAFGPHAFAFASYRHGISVGPDGCRMLFIMAPAGMEEIIRARSEPARNRTLPPPSEHEPTPEEMDALNATIKEHGYELLI